MPLAIRRHRLKIILFLQNIDFKTRPIGMFHYFTVVLVLVPAAKLLPHKNSVTTNDAYFRSEKQFNGAVFVMYWDV